MTDPFAGMRLRCTYCRPHPPKGPKAFRKPDDPETVCRCQRCGKKHSTDSLEVI
ncbi:hypothetical protein [Halostagnicola sp. A56]|uniref:hypothetical protein n=1 Tax=Halostagnicola sp. A56 TaxID=1495067 RepID=UPI0012E2542C|nr:hypothetical protein [Halostagnicola sp. A56]